MNSIKKLHGFTLASQDDLKDFRCRGELWVHDRTKTPVYKVYTSDPENLFSFSFRTTPADSTGVAHIVEHSVLAGSKNFPTKDPFLYLLKSSLQTFLNAMTFPDKTVYPGSSLVEKDYFNLMEVYGDAVFFPLLKKEIFQQEGWRLEENSEGKLELSGVVFNEMKGNYSSAEGVIQDHCLQSLCNDGPYSMDGGGDPRFIPDLSWEQFREFHRRHYHPSNCQVLLYGCFDLEPQLELLDRKFFSLFDPMEPVPLPVRQIPWTQPRSLELKVPSQEGENGSTLALSWLGPGPLEQKDFFLVDLVSDLLLGDAGLLTKALLESGLGEDISPVSGFETEILQGNFTIGLRGADPAGLESFRTLVMEELEKYAAQGIPQDLLESTLAAYEFSLKEIKGAGRGLRLMRRLLRGWNFGLTPAQSLAFTSHLEALKQDLDLGQPVFQNLIKKWLLGNNHRADLVFLPDSTFTSELESALARRVADWERTLGPQDRELIRQDNRRLREFQTNPESPEALAKLPKLQRKDLPRKIEVLESRREDPGFPLFIHHGDTNDVAYVDLAIDASSLNSEDYLWVTVLTRCAEGLGLENLDYHMLARKIQLLTGGLSFRFSADQGFLDGNLRETFWVRMKMLSSKIDPAFDLLEDLVFRQDWNNLDRLKDLVLELKNHYQSAVVPQGHHFVSLKAAASFHLPSFLMDQMGGLTQLEHLQTLARTLDQPGVAESLRDRLRALWKKLWSRGSLRANISGEESFLPPLQARLESFASKLSAEAVYPGLKVLSPLADETQVYTAGIGVGHTAWVFPSTGELSDHPKELFLAHLWSTTDLWESIRMKGGAYGAFASAHPSEGWFLFNSYRDPRIVDTFQAYLNALEKAVAVPLSKEDLDLVLIGTIGKELVPLSPSEEGYIYFSRWLKGITDQHRQQRRDGYFQITAKDLQTAAARLLALSKEGFAVVVSSREKWEACAGDWKGRPPVVKELVL